VKESELDELARRSCVRVVMELTGVLVEQQPIKTKELRGIIMTKLCEIQIK